MMTRTLKISFAICALASLLSACAQPVQTPPSYADVRAVSPALEHYTKASLLGDVWKRPGLSPRDRSLVTVSALIANGQTGQLSYHLNRAMDNGLTGAEVGEVLTQLAFYVGWPSAFSAMPVVKDTLEKRSEKNPSKPAAAHMEVQRAESSAATAGSPNFFTGSAMVTQLFSAREPTHVSGGSVTFAPGTRGHWHTHPVGQILIITAGTGWVQESEES
jgi:4-carboxymuconolactone decarboxylase